MLNAIIWGIKLGPECKSRILHLPGSTTHRCSIIFPMPTQRYDQKKNSTCSWHQIYIIWITANCMLKHCSSIHYCISTCIHFQPFNSCQKTFNDSILLNICFNYIFYPLGQHYNRNSATSQIFSLHLHATLRKLAMWPDDGHNSVM